MPRSFASQPFQDPTALTVGEWTFPRASASLMSSMPSGTMRATYFTAQKTETVTQIRVVGGSTAAGATPTLVKFGLFSAAADGALTLLAATASDTSVFSVANTRYTRSLTGSVSKVAGQRYAVGVLVVTAAAAPTVACTPAATGMSGEFTEAPYLGATATGLSDMPASVAVGSLSGSGNVPYAAVLP
jgi:hypothetical protein